MSKGKVSGVYRSAKTGRFATTAGGKRNPGTTVFERPGKSGSTGGAYRSAKSGRFVTAAHGMRSPGTTLHEK